MAGALYNRYRPRTFAEVVGQDHVTGALQAALAGNRLHHAYLFSGPRGCGKTSSARILAASINCVDGPTPTPCGTCEQCVGIRTGASLDVIELDAASHNGVDDARDLRDRVAFAPASARHKVYVIDEAHMVTTAAFNALLKVVEEPPPFVTFIFATTEPEKVIQTIRSRTFHYHFRLVPPRELLTHLERLCSAEGVPVEPAVLPLVVRAGGGSVRDSMSVLDQLLSGAGPAGVTYPQAAALLGLTDAVLLDRVVDTLAAADGATAFHLVDEVVNAGHDPRRFAADLLERLRDLIVLAAVPDAVERDLLAACPADQLERMRTQAQAMGAAGLSRAADLVHAGLAEMKGTTAPRLVLELMLARILLPAAAADPAAWLVRLERLEQRAEAPVPVAGTAPAAPRREGSAPGGPVAPATAAAPATAPGEADRATPPGSAPPAGPTAATASAAAGGPAPPRAAPARRPGADATRPAPPAPVWPTPARAPAPPAPAAAPAAGEAGPGPAGAAPSAPSGGDGGAGGAAGSHVRPGLASVDVVAVRERWPAVLDAVREHKQVTAALLHRSMVASVSGGEMTLILTGPALVRRWQASTLHAEVLRAALTDVLGLSFGVTVTAEPPGAAGPGTSPGAPETASGRARAAEAFAPGDGPAEEETDAAAEPRRHGEDAALAALKDHLGAKVIGEIAAG